MRVTTRTGRNTYVSIGCGGLLLIAVIVLGLIGWAFNAATGHAATRPAAVRFTPVTQDYIDGCVPASSSMLLSGFGISVSQDVLARQMHTYVHHGTYGADATRVLNSYLGRRHLRMAGGGFVPAVTLGALLRAQTAAGHPVMVTVRALQLPWRRADKVVVIHVIVVTGIRGTQVTVFDPLMRALHGGWHTLGIDDLDRALIATGTVVRT